MQTCTVSSRHEPSTLLNARMPLVHASRTATGAWWYTPRRLLSRIVVSAQMAPQKLYAVRKGRSTGIYGTWPECQDQVHGYPGAQYKSFDTLADAESYLAGGQVMHGLQTSPRDQAQHPGRFTPYSKPQRSLLPQPSQQQHSVHPQAFGCATNAGLGPQPPFFNKPTTFTAAAARGKPTADQVLELCRACAGAACDRVQHVNQSPKAYQLNFDGASRGNPGAAGSGAVIVEKSTGAEVLRLVCPLPFGCTNNEAEYAGLILGLEACVNLGIKQPLVFGDSQLVVNQVNGTWKTNQPSLTPYCHAACKLMAELKAPALQHVYREQNSVADELSNRAVDLSLRR